MEGARGGSVRCNTRFRRSTKLYRVAGVGTPPPEAMLKAKEKGAVWDGAAWSIIDRAITIDPAVMVTTTTP